MLAKINIKRHLKPQSTTIHLKLLSDHQPLRKNLPDDSLCLPEEKQQRWGQPRFSWEGVPESGSSNWEGPLPCPHQVRL